MFTSRGRPVRRCGIYTRQSVARGEQDLTSCDVQCERCENYERSMQYEGSVALDERFDDLGVSGGSLERPVLRRLLSWCVEGRIDIIVVASLDRLATGKRRRRRPLAIERAARASELCFY